MQFNVAIIGAGLIGRKRAAAISKTGIGSLRAVVDKQRCCKEACY
ncbi:hypothetical protein [Candidatus Kryptonium thompsonii]|nr:hypothetical protein [Candidatus Kryptonium thompsoni]CUT05614.1 hypothetical protein JGI5_02031 [Candidatus Kryptonium thompsoni]